MSNPAYPTELVVANAINGVVLGIFVAEDEDVLVYQAQDGEYGMTSMGVVRRVERRLGRLPVRLAKGPDGQIRA